MLTKRCATSVVLLSLASMLVSCSSESSTYTSGGRVSADPVQDVDGVTRILVYYDMEGISGQNDINSLGFGNPEYDTAREWLTNDVNAVIDGLFAGRAVDARTEIQNEDALRGRVFSAQVRLRQCRSQRDEQ